MLLDPELWYVRVMYDTNVLQIGVYCCPDKVEAYKQTKRINDPCPIHGVSSITIGDLINAHGLDYNTVSNILNHMSYVSKGTDGMEIVG